MDWHSHGFNLPVLKRTRLTPRQNEVFASAKQSRRIRNLSGQMAVPMSAASAVRVQSAPATVAAPRLVRDLDQSEAVTAAAPADCPCSIRSQSASALNPCARISGQLYVAVRRVNVLLASSGCAPHCTRRRLRGFCLYDSAPGVLSAVNSNDAGS